MKRLRKSQLETLRLVHTGSDTVELLMQATESPESSTAARARSLVESGYLRRVRGGKAGVPAVFALTASGAEAIGAQLTVVDYPSNLREFRTLLGQLLRRADAPERMVHLVEDLDYEGMAVGAVIRAWLNLSGEFKDEAPARHPSLFTLHVHDCIIDMGEFVYSATQRKIVDTAAAVQDMASGLQFRKGGV